MPKVKKILLGQIVFLKDGRTGEIREATVSYVGRKYFKLNGNVFDEYKILDLKGTFYVRNNKVFLSMQEAIDSAKNIQP